MLFPFIQAAPDFLSIPPPPFSKSRHTAIDWKEEEGERIQDRPGGRKSGNEDASFFFCFFPDTEAATPKVFGLVS